MNRNAPLLLGLVAIALATAAGAQGEVCEAPREVDRYQLLRRLSLDLRGQVPTYEEYLALDGAADVPADTIRDMIASDAFLAETRRYHESFLWPNVSTVGLSDNNYRIGNRGHAWAKPNTTWARLQRNMNTRVDNVLPAFQYCGDYEQTQFDPAFPGEFRPVVPPDPETGFRIEGWRWVTPYWAPETQIKVCAYEAQETVYPNPPETLTTIDGKPDQRRRCSDRSGANQVGCGCGPNLIWCSPSGPMETVVKASFREQFGLSVDEVSSGRAPYTDLLLSKKAYENGPIAWFSKNFGRTTNPGAIYAAPDRTDAPNRDFTDDAWVQVDRGGVHAGVLTLPAYLLRFQTQRSRANRMLEAFACEPYVAPADLIPRPGCSTDAADLTNRCFCQSCHSSLEPIAAAWGKFSESGTTMLTDAERFPDYLKGCEGSGSAFCRRLYVTDRNSPAKGKPLPYEFALAHPDYPQIIQAGPARAAQKLIDTGTFAQCTVRRLFTRLMRRDVIFEGSNAVERELLEQLASEFEASNYDYPALVERLVTLPEYRRVR